MAWDVGYLAADGAWVADSLLDAAVVYSTASFSEVAHVGFSRSPRGGCQLLQQLARCPSVQEGLLQPLALLEWEPPQIHE